MVDNLDTKYILRYLNLIFIFFAKNQTWSHWTEIEASWLQGACEVVLKTDNSSVLSITVLHADNTISMRTKFKISF